jgi:hypothetical protein
MPRNNKKNKQPILPKINHQIPISSIRSIKILGPRYYLQHAREYPFLGWWVMEGWQEEGITPVVIARQQESNKIIYAVCLVDLYCLGIKDAYANADTSQRKFQSELTKVCNGAPESCSVELAHEIIYGGLEYAQRYGFEPHPDYTRQFCDQVLDPPGTHPRKNNVAFGKNGKPYFVSGPYDDERKIRFVINTLGRTAGEGNFDVIAGFGPPASSDD